MIAQTVAGALLFLFASKLSSSMFFRLGTGSAGVMMLSVVILLFMISRLVTKLFLPGEIKPVPYFEIDLKFPDLSNKIL